MMRFPHPTTSPPHTQSSNQPTLLIPPPHNTQTQLPPALRPPALALDLVMRRPGSQHRHLAADSFPPSPDAVDADVGGGVGEEEGLAPAYLQLLQGALRLPAGGWERGLKRCVRYEGRRG